MKTNFNDFINENKHYDIDNKLYLLKSYIHILNNDEDEHTLAKRYFLIIHNWLIIERMFYDDVVAANKEININLELKPLDSVKKVLNKFMELYNVNHPVRNNIETFDSIESIRQYLKNNSKVYTELL